MEDADAKSINQGPVDSEFLKMDVDQRTIVLSQRIDRLDARTKDILDIVADIKQNLDKNFNRRRSSRSDRGSSRGSPTPSQSSRVASPSGPPRFASDAFSRPSMPVAAREEHRGPQMTPMHNALDDAAELSPDEVNIAATVKLDRRRSSRDRQALPTPPVLLSDSSESEFSMPSQVGLIAHRRESMLHPKPAVAKTAATPVAVYHEQASYSDITLKWLTVNQVFKFWQDITLYQAMHKIDLEPATLVQVDCRRRIMVKCGIRTEIDFFRLTPSLLRKCIQKAVRPTDRGMFARRLLGSLTFGKSDDAAFNLTLDTYERFYDYLLVYRNEFQDKFEFLAYHNDQCVPKLENKDGGTIKIFLTKLPSEYANRVFQQLPKTRFDSLNEFLDHFYTLAAEHHQISILSKKLTSYLLPTSKGFSSSNSSKRENRFVSKVNRIAEFDEEEEYYEETVRESYREIPEPQDEPPEPVEPQELPNSSLNAFGGGLNRGVPQRLPPKPPSAVKPPAAVKGPNGCFRALTEGKCSKPNCTFDHSSAALEATLVDLQARLGKSLWRARPVNAIHAPENSFEPLADDNG